MRRLTSALTAGTLGAALMASVVSAQQYQSSAGGQGNSPAASGSASASLPAPAQTDAAAALDTPGAGTVSNPIVGMAATRGARYLLRNGLDYLNYQEYERALKLLREAETRQKELGETEKLQLKQGIERAQRGLRAAVGSQRPYALSSRSRPGGFAVAKPESRIAIAKSQPPAEAGTEPGSSRVPSREGDDQGQPIQLAGAAVPAAAPALSQTTPGADPVAAPVAAGLPGPVPASTDQPAPLPEIPKLPASPATTNSTVAEQNSIAPSQASPVQDASASPASPNVPLAPPLDTGSRTPMSEQSLDTPAPIPSALPAATAPGQELDRPVTAGPAPALPGPVPEAVDPKPSKDSETTLASNAPASELHPELPSATAPATPPETAPATPTETAPATPAEAERLADPGTKPAPSTASTPAPEPLAAAQPTPSAETPAPEPLAAVQPTPSAETPSLAATTSTSAPLGPGTTEAAQPSPSTGDELPPLPEDITAAAEANRSDSQKRATMTAKAANDDAATNTPKAAKNEDASNTSALPAELPGASQIAARSDAEKSQADALPPAAHEIPRKPANEADNAPPVQELSAKPVLPAEPVLTPVAGPAAAANSASAAASQPSASAEVPPENRDATTASAPTSPSTSVPEAALPPNQEAGSSTVPASVPAEEPAPAPGPVQESAAQPPASVETPQPPLGLSGVNPFAPRTQNPTSTLDADQRRRIQEIARMQEEDLRRRQAQPDASSRVGMVQPPSLGPTNSNTDLRTQTQTQVDISRAPSPAEARPIRAIPVPEDWVPLARRDWSPQRKYWAAAATCHLPLYFQDAMLERYGHSVENYFGPLGRYMAYPVDDHTQSTQRNQMVQPFFSAGLFAWHIITWPYALVVDPPWEAQYDLGYWRPGDRIPTDLYYQPLTGTGPALRGRNY